MKKVSCEVDAGPASRLPFVAEDERGTKVLFGEELKPETEPEGRGMPPGGITEPAPRIGPTTLCDNKYSFMRGAS